MGPNIWTHIKSEHLHQRSHMFPTLGLHPHLDHGVGGLTKSLGGRGDERCRGDQALSPLAVVSRVPGLVRHLALAHLDRMVMWLRLVGNGMFKRHHHCLPS